MLTSYTFTPHLIMGQVFYGSDPGPTWPTHICWPIWPMTHWPVVYSVDELSFTKHWQTDWLHWWI